MSQTSAPRDKRPCSPQQNLDQKELGRGIEEGVLTAATAIAGFSPRDFGDYILRECGRGSYYRERTGTG